MRYHFPIRGGAGLIRDEEGRELIRQRFRTPV
jgi:hypothetical protein